MAEAKAPRVKIDVQASKPDQDVAPTEQLPVAKEQAQEDVAPVEQRQDASAPQVVIEFDGGLTQEESAASEEGQPQQAAQDEQAAGQQVEQSATDATKQTAAAAPAAANAGATSADKPAKPAPIISFGWLSRHFPGHEHAVVGCLCGMVAAILMFTLGFWRTVFMMLLMALGAEAGASFDGNGHRLPRSQGKSGDTQ